MSQKLKLSIAQPCHENWQQMNPTEQGKFCNACAKEVVDFTSMSDTEVLNHFIKRKNENTCGRFYNDQLNREISKPVYSAKNISWYWNYLAMLFMLLFKSETVKSQTIIKPIKIEQLSNVDRSVSITLGGVSAGVPVVNVIFSGQVTSERGEVVPGATVQVKGANKAIITDESGRYKLTGIKDGDLLQISAVGYCSKEVKAGSSGNQVSILKMEVMGEVVVVGYTIADHEYTAPAAPMHVAVIEVRDDQNSLPVKATIKIDNDDDEEQTTVTTNKNGVYKLRGIGEKETYKVTITAEGYKDSVLNIDGWKFSDNKETRYVFLKRKDTIAAEKRQIRIGGVQTRFKEPMYVVDGLLSSAEKVQNINPAEIEKIDVLKEAALTAIYGSPAAAGVIIITTKKHLTAQPSTQVIADKKQTISEAKKLDPGSITNFKIAPNPIAKGAACNLSFTATSTGEYNLQILNAAGILVQSQKIIVTQKQHVLQLQINANWASGIYYVAVSDNKGMVQHVDRFIIK